MKIPLINRLSNFLSIPLFLLCLYPARSQPTGDSRIKIVAKERQQFETQSAYLNHKSGYIDKAESMNIHPVIANNWYRSKVNIAKYKQFKRIGVDLDEIARMTNHITDYKFYTLFSDVIIKGKVVKKVYE